MPFHLWRGFFNIDFIIMNKLQKFGIGLEAEGFIMNNSGKPISRINGRPASAWVLSQLKERIPHVAGHITLELASVFLEIRSSVHLELQQAVKEVLVIRFTINEILKACDGQLVFTPVSTLPFEFVASTDKPGSRAAELVSLWGKSKEGQENLIASSIASLQVNDSRPFQNCRDEMEYLEKARQVHNLCRVELPKHRQILMTNKQDFRGKTRLENYTSMVERVKRDQFEVRGFRVEEIVVPPKFSDILGMQNWMCAHSNVSSFASTSAKNEHALTCKIKRHPWIVEVRYPDAVDTEDQMVKAVSAVEKILKPTYENEGSCS
ncbi:MAG: hypothetical protein A2V81_01295 [Candidatus Abawacabacteria bacterium RBG_16_42_10]|uniref:Uncharacterized protein n=1 Tax=Candidatus Abawacabacteria bacterium RBG_16_42_10 TaxID=1817814 RepID=A0A1F4XLT8_9BACT|nr:MAG: hypothetical protein A2V81_01295 [Candidatus Abawacabacteria bacterium RBG_16_42_10]